MDEQTLKKLLPVFIGKERARKNLTQEVVARRSGMLPNYYRELESGKVGLTVRKAYQIANGLDYDLSGFFQAFEDFVEEQP